MTSPSEEPQSLPHYRIGALKGFIPLSEEASFSTRGQHLPQLLRDLSQSNLAALQRWPSSPGRPTRRRRSSNDEVEPALRCSDEVDVESQRSGEQDWRGGGPDKEREDRRMSAAAAVLMTPQMRSQRLIGNSNPRYKWEKYYKTDAQLKNMSKPLRQYYERNNYLIQQYMYIDRLLDSSLPHTLIQEYQHTELYSAAGSQGTPHVPATINEETGASPAPSSPNINGNGHMADAGKKLKRTPKDLYKVHDESTPLLVKHGDDDDDEQAVMPEYEPEDETGSQDRIVTIAIYINLVANTVLLILKIIVTLLTSSVSVLASLIDSALDFLSTAIVWVTTRMISHNDQYQYPVGRRRLEPIGVLVFSVIMITSFVQVGIEGVNHLTASDHTIVQLSNSAIGIMVGTVVVKFACWLWCRFIKNSSVQALAQDAMTDVVFNTFSIIFPLIGYYAKVWWLDPAGGIVLSLYVILNWSRTSAGHIRNLTGAAATADERNVLLYLTMRFAKTIKQIQGLQAYHAGDKLNVEVDIVLDENMSLRDSHDLGESLQYVLESVPTVDRAFVHQDYAGWNLPSHMQQND